MTVNPKFRLILDPPRSAALNMSIDEFLMAAQNSSDSLPTIRFYSWSTPAYSIGYFQNIEEIVKRFDCEKKNIPVVRRITGGGVVFHGQDITFSISVKKDNPFFKGQAKDSYLRVNEALRIGLKALFPDLDYADCKSIPSGRAGKERVCFTAPVCYDLLMNGKKVVGASQRRKEGAVLHQSSIFLDGGKNLMINGILNGFREKWKIEFKDRPLTEDELLAAKAIEQNRSVSSEWSYLAADLERSFLS